MQKTQIAVKAGPILKKLIDKYNKESWYLSKEEIERKSYSFFPGKWKGLCIPPVTPKHRK